MPCWRRVSERTKIVFLANPNNPTGTYLPFDEIKRLHRALPPHVLLVLDAAYAEYVRRNDYESGIELVATSDNVVWRERPTRPRTDRQRPDGECDQRSCDKSDAVAPLHDRRPRHHSRAEGVHEHANSCNTDRIWKESARCPGPTQEPRTAGKPSAPAIRRIRSTSVGAIAVATARGCVAGMASR